MGASPAPTAEEGLSIWGLQGHLAPKKQPPLGPYSRTMPRALWWPHGGGLFIMSRYPCRAPPRPARQPRRRVEAAPQDFRVYNLCSRGSVSGARFRVSGLRRVEACRGGTCAGGARKCASSIRTRCPDPSSGSRHRTRQHPSTCRVSGLRSGVCEEA